MLLLEDIKKGGGAGGHSEREREREGGGGGGGGNERGRKACTGSHTQWEYCGLTKTK